MPNLIACAVASPTVSDAGRSFNQDYVETYVESLVEGLRWYVAGLSVQVRENGVPERVYVNLPARRNGPAISINGWHYELMENGQLRCIGQAQ